MNASSTQLFAVLSVVFAMSTSLSWAQEEKADPLKSLNEHLAFITKNMAEGHGVVEELRAGFDLDKCDLEKGKLDLQARLKLAQTNWDKENGLGLTINLSTNPVKNKDSGKLSAKFGLEIKTLMVPMLNKVASIVVENEIIAPPAEDAPFMQKTIYQFLNFLKDDFTTMDQLYVTFRALVGGLAALYETADDPNMTQILNALEPRWEGNGFRISFKRTEDTLPLLDSFLFLENLSFEVFDDHIKLGTELAMEFKGEGWEEQMDGITQSIGKGVVSFSENLDNEEVRNAMLEKAQELFDVLLLLMTVDEESGFGLGRAPLR